MAERRPAWLALLPLLIAGACADPEAAPIDLDAWRGLNALAEGRYALARTYYAADLEQHPDRVESLRGLALAWSRGPDQALGAAQAALVSYLEQVPDDDDMRLRYARNLLLLGDRDAARATSRELGSTYERALLDAEIMGDDDPDAAWNLLVEHLDDDEVRGQTLAATLLARRGDHDAALAHTRRAVALAPLAEPNWYQLGRSLMATGDRAAAERALRVHRTLGIVNRGGTNGAPLAPIEALRMLDGLDDDFPHDARTVLALKVRLQLQAGFVDQALALLPSFSETVDVDTRLQLAVLLAQRGRPQAAESLFRESLAVEPSNRRARAGLVSVLLPDAARKPDRHAEATALLDAGLTDDPHLARYHMLRGRLARGDGDLATATDAFVQALDLAPWHVPWRLELADLHLTRDQREAAIVLLRQAPDATPAIDAFRRARGLPVEGRP